jgi:hypothetical protein
MSFSKFIPTKLEYAIMCNRIAVNGKKKWMLNYCFITMLGVMKFFFRTTVNHVNWVMKALQNKQLNYVMRVNRTTKRTTVKLCQEFN